MRRALLLAGLWATVGCTAHVTGSLQVDGTAFATRDCRSGAPLGFSGIELWDEQGRYLRLDVRSDRVAVASVVAAGNPTGDSLGPCGVVLLDRGTGVINGVRNLEGKATLSCANDHHQVSGHIAFENCH